MLRRKHYSAKTQVIKTSVPYGSTKVEYLESSGTQHLIIANVYANQNHEVSAEIDAHFHNNDEVIILFGSRTAWKNSACAVTYGFAETIDITNTGFAQFENQTPKFISLPYHGKRTKINLSKNGLKLNDEIVAQFDEVKNFTSSNPYCICSTKSPDIDYRKMAGKIYNFNVKDSNKDVIKLIPSIDKTGTPCMFDLVTRKNFYNVGTGQFIYPTTSTTYSLRIPQAEWAKMTDTGIHKIYHTPIGYDGSIEDYAIENGYKRLIETESPNEEGKYYSFKWVETDDTLTTEWFEIDPPQEEFFEENLDNSQIS